MEVVSRLIKVQFPNYLKSLPIPSTFGGFAKLSGNEWVQLVPFVVTTSVVVYLVISAILPSKPSKKADADWVNKTEQKEKEKVADIIQIEDLGEKTAYCRCWKSKKFPLCDGSHNQHNKETGDNVGPLVCKRANPSS
ncbi:CDGSH iron-sulfur domain-containing protein 2 [Porites harrisoni]